ncbi:hypothetical protein ACFXO9_14915 [Nocardia tengchongensis]|uniref:hypothetical protein n=1 Tax=Nocardia tengchongensis TaxID=2055889 RepID=UPI0036A27B34
MTSRSTVVAAGGALIGCACLILISAQLFAAGSPLAAMLAVGMSATAVIIATLVCIQIRCALAAQRLATADLPDARFPDGTQPHRGGTIIGASGPCRLRNAPNGPSSYKDQR